MSVQNVVLGELIRRRGSGYGYELRDTLREFSELLGYSSTFVYACLSALEKRGFVRVLEREGAAGQASARVYYEVTPAGARHFQRWMDTPPAKSPLREEMHLQLFEMEADDVPRLISFLTTFEEQCREQTRALMAEPFGTHSPSGRAIGAMLVNSGLIAHLQAMMEWAQQSRRALVNVMDHPPGARGRRRP